jgi:hypothetical protein
MCVQQWLFSAVVDGGDSEDLGTECGRNAIRVFDTGFGCSVPSI